MSCKYCNFDGVCELYDPDFQVENFNVDEEGFCMNDENSNCEDFEKY